VAAMTEEAVEEMTEEAETADKKVRGEG